MTQSPNPIHQPEASDHYLWLVELFHRGDTGNSLGRYHTGFTTLSGLSRSTENVFEAKRYSSKDFALKVAEKLTGLQLSALEWRAVEHGLVDQPPSPPVEGVGEAVGAVLTRLNRDTGISTKRAELYERFSDLETGTLLYAAPPARSPLTEDAEAQLSTLRDQVARLERERDEAQQAERQISEQCDALANEFAALKAAPLDVEPKA